MLSFKTMAISALTTILMTVSSVALPLSDEQIAVNGNLAIFGPPELAKPAVEALVERGDQDIIATLILAMRYGSNSNLIQRALSKLTNQKIDSWNKAMLWQEANTNIKPHISYQSAKLDLFKRIDPNFMQFLQGDLSKPENMKIRLEEIVWGGVTVDGIPALDNPKHISVAKAMYLKKDDLVFGVSINGDARAYPLRIMGWHEMFNDVVGGVPVSLAYCTLCGAGILFETSIDQYDTPFIFGSSGFLYRSNKLMFDRQTKSLWNQFTGEPVSGSLVNSGIKLKLRPVTITTWQQWKKRHKNTKVLSLETGHRRDYSSGVVYNEYFSSPDLMFPAIVKDETSTLRKDYVFGIRENGVAKAWPLKSFEQQTVQNKNFAGRNIVLIGNPANRTVRAYERGNDVFKPDTDQTLTAANAPWSIEEDQLIGPNGQIHKRISGHIAYWFAWENYFGANGG